jgi:hypothetical protein
LFDWVGTTLLATPKADHLLSAFDQSIGKKENFKLLFSSAVVSLDVETLKR